MLPTGSPGESDAQAGLRIIIYRSHTGLLEIHDFNPRTNWDSSPNNCIQWLHSSLVGGKAILSSVRRGMGGESTKDRISQGDFELSLILTQSTYYMKTMGEIGFSRLIPSLSCSSVCLTARE